MIMNSRDFFYFCTYSLNGSSSFLLKFLKYTQCFFGLFGLSDLRKYLATPCFRRSSLYHEDYLSRCRGFVAYMST